MKRFFCVLAAFLLLGCSAGLADRHLGVVCEYTGETETGSWSADFYEQEDMIYCLSTMLPDIIVTQKKNDLSLSDFGFLFSVNPSQIQQIRQMSRDFFRLWMQQQTVQKKSGFYTGDLFDCAETMETCTFQLNDFIRFAKEYLLRQSAINTTRTGRYFRDVLNVGCRLIESFVSGTNPVVTFKSYDEGKYISIVFSANTGDLLTVSADYSTDPESRYVLRYKEASRYYFRNLSILSTEEEYTLSSELYSSSNPDYHSAVLLIPLFRDALTIRDSQDSGRDYTFELASDKTVSPFVISGNIKDYDDQCTRASLTAFIREHEQEGFRISVAWDKEEMKNFTGMRILDRSYPAEMAEINQVFLTQITVLLAEIMPNLPPAYQTLLTALIFNE